jgi:hypothetical protein
MGMTAVAFGAPPPGKGGGGGSGGGPPEGKGNKPDTEVGFSLSVPAIIVGTGSKFVINCPADGWSGTPIVTGGEPVPYPAACADTVTGDGIAYCMDEGSYFVQRQHAWQAQCTTAETASVDAEWGDNLSGDAMLKVGSPIRVEMVLFDSSGVSAGEQGFYVIKLQPDELDRNSDYGHLAGDNGAVARLAGAPVDFPYGIPEDKLPETPPTFRAVVYDAEASLTIELLDEGGYVASTVYDGAAGAEINATGKIVYGHNLRVGVAGTYRLTYTFSNLAIDSVDIGTFTNVDGVAAATLEIKVAGGGGGGGKKK